jgi:hypothetical protein
MRIAIGYSESSPPPVSMGAAIWFLGWGVWGGARRDDRRKKAAE